MKITDEMVGKLGLPYRVSTRGATNDGAISIMVSDETIEEGALVARIAFTRSDVKKKDAWGADDELRDARAAFIVTACNSHQALVDALKTFRDEIANCAQFKNGTLLARDLIKKADAALALAEPDQ